MKVDSFLFGMFSLRVIRRETIWAILMSGKRLRCAVVKPSRFFVYTRLKMPAYVQSYRGRDGPIAAFGESRSSNDKHQKLICRKSAICAEATSMPFDSLVGLKQIAVSSQTIFVCVMIR